ncbi:MAG: preprotein translocase subunit YajC [Elusimicrobiota bacterium]
MLKKLALSLFLFAPAAAWAEAPAASGGGLMNFAPLAMVVVIFYFLLIRPQQKQAKEHKKMLEELKRGDRILTQGGLYGTVSAVKGKVLEVKLADELKVQMAKSAVTQVLTGDPAQETEPAASH